MRVEPKQLNPLIRRFATPSPLRGEGIKLEFSGHIRLQHPLPSGTKGIKKRQKRYNLIPSPLRGEGVAKRRMRGISLSFLHSIQNRFQHTLNVNKHLIIPKP